MISRSFVRGLLAVLFAISGRAQFEIRGSRLYIDGNAFPVHGVSYNPTPIGQTAGAVLQLSGCLYARDFPLMPLAGINTVRLYGRVPAGESVLWRELQDNHLYVLAGFPLDAYYDPQATLSADDDAGRTLRSKIIEDLRQYARQLQNSKRVIALIFGNEVTANYHTHFAGNPRDFYTLVQEAANMLQSEFGSAAPLLTTAVADNGDIGQPALAARDSDLPGLAFWSVNVFRGQSFRGLFDELRGKTAKPVLIAAFGIDAFDNTLQREDADSQAAAVHSLARELAREMARPDSRALGGVWFSWSDEWWRGGPDASRHGTAGSLQDGFPDGVINPGWFGLFGLVATGQPGLDSLRPRSAFAALAQEWGGALPAAWPAPMPELSPQGVVNAGSLQATIAPGSLMSLFGQNLAPALTSGSASSPPFHMGLTSACLAGQAIPLLAAGPSQINGQAPWASPTGTAAAVIAYRAGIASNSVTVNVQAFAPGILDRGVLPAGRPCPVSTVNGVRPGAYLEIYGTGLGSARDAPPTGFAPETPVALGNPPRVFLSGQELRVLYSGLVPGVVGLYQTDVQVSADFSPSSSAGLQLLAGGVLSNPYPISVINGLEQPGYTLGGDTLNFLVQAGGPPQTAFLSIDGYNGFCELVRFSVSGLPAGISASLPVGFPGQRIPVSVQAAPQAPGISNAGGVIQGDSLAPQNPSIPLQVSVLPSQGDITFRVTSGGGRAGLVARFEMAGRLLAEVHGGGPGRGFNFLTLDGTTGLLGTPYNFDTWLNEQASEDMADYLASLPPGTVVLGAIADEGTLHLTPRGRAALQHVLHAQTIDLLQYQDSWAIISRVGSSLPFAEDRAGDRQVLLQSVLTFPMP